MRHDKVDCYYVVNLVDLVNSSDDDAMLCTRARAFLTRMDVEKEFFEQMLWCRAVIYSQISYNPLVFYGIKSFRNNAGSWQAAHNVNTDPGADVVKAWPSDLRQRILDHGGARVALLVLSCLSQLCVGKHEVLPQM